MIKSPQQRKPLRNFSSGDEYPFAFPSPGSYHSLTLNDIVGRKHLVWSSSYGDITDKNFIEMLATNLFHEQSDREFYLLISPKPRGFKERMKNLLPGLEFNFTRHFIRVFSILKNKNPIKDFIEFVVQFCNWEQTVIFSIEKDTNIEPLFPEGKHPGFLDIFDASSAFIYVDCDGYLLLGLDRQLGELQPEIKTLIRH